MTKERWWQKNSLKKTWMHATTPSLFEWTFECLVLRSRQSRRTCLAFAIATIYSTNPVMLKPRIHATSMSSMLAVLTPVYRKQHRDAHLNGGTCSFAIIHRTMTHVGGTRLRFIKECMVVTSTVYVPHKPFSKLQYVMIADSHPRMSGWCTVVRQGTFAVHAWANCNRWLGQRYHQLTLGVHQAHIRQTYVALGERALALRTTMHYRFLPEKTISHNNTCSSSSSSSNNPHFLSHACKNSILLGIVSNDKNLKRLPTSATAEASAWRPQVERHCDATSQQWHGIMAYS
jgi:hypothetical protein